MTQIYIGTYAKPGGAGLYPLALSADGSLKAGLCDAPARNASFGAYSSARDLHYLADECEGLLGVWRRDRQGWQALGAQQAHGEEPCYVAIDEGCARLALANYKSGNVTLFALDDAGLPIDPPDTFQDAGSGPVEDRQEGPHVHCVRFAPGGDSLYAVDLGADHVLRFDLDGARLGPPAIAYRAPAGSGPRHLLFHPQRPFALLLSELAATLTLLRVAEGKLHLLATCPTAPADFTGDNLGGHLEWPSTGRAYVSNRGHDSVALIAVDLDAETLAPRRHVRSGGKSPRHFLIAEDVLVVAHEKDGAVASFRIGDDGSLAPTGHNVRVRGACYVFRA
jgi:6-phosphogluconolactonase